MALFGPETTGQLPAWFWIPVAATDVALLLALVIELFKEDRS